MRSPGKDAYHRFHAELGSTSAPAFEYLPNREQAAWLEASKGSCDHHCWQMESDMVNLREKVQELTMKLHHAFPKPVQQPARHPGRTKFKRVK